MEELRLYHYPVAVKFFFDDEELATFKEKAEFYVPVKPMTFCQWELAARMKGQTVLATREDLGCSNALVSFGWKDIDDNEIKSHIGRPQPQAYLCLNVREGPKKCWISLQRSLPLGLPWCPSG